MTFAWATDNTALRTTTTETITQRFETKNIKTRYYNPAIHVASFALPQYILDALATSAQ